MRWQKCGLVFSPDRGSNWTKTHAQVPTPLDCDGFIRVYFSSRPERTLSLTTFVDLDANDPAKVLRVNPDPILKLGRPGTFDEHGIMPSCAIRHGSLVFLYYSGWSRAASVPYTNSTGLAISEDGGKTFEKVSEGPILGRSLQDPYSATSPVVVREGTAWHMWYCSGTGWLKIDGRYEHTYDIRYARSSDGIHWTPFGTSVINQQTEYEALTRPFVLKAENGYDMWYCYRGSHDFRDGKGAYRIGYAHSEDLQRWVREDEKAGIDLSDAGWDSKMIAYPAVVTVNERTLLFYNGNGFGANGFGYAVLAPQGKEL
jgi:predicted GH43/DUF377 family glycosyl hydrolase